MVSYLPPSDRSADRVRGFLPERMKSISLLFMLFLFASATAVAQAPDLYSGFVPVEDRSQSAREAAFPRALEQVLGKLSGKRYLVDHPMVGPAIESARSLVVSFYYDQYPPATARSEDPGRGDGVREATTILVVRFSQPGVDNLVRLLGLPRWPPSREPLVVWLLIDDGLSRRVMPVEYAYLQAPIDRVAQERGLPLAWPEAGDDGDFGVDVQLLWGGYTESLTANGEAPSVLVVAARREGPEWNARLILEYGGVYWTWRNRHFDLEQALTEAMHQAVDEIAAMQSIAPSDQGLWVHEISVAGIQSADDYTRCLGYLESLSVVERVSIDHADSSVVGMSLTLNAAPEYFEEAVADGRMLEYAETSRQYVLQR